jgi:hypothetical protein
MYEELTTAIQQERERAIRAPGLHHRGDLPPAAPMFARLRTALASLVEPMARRPSRDEGKPPALTGKPDLSGSAHGPRRSGSNAAPG